MVQQEEVFVSEVELAGLADKLAAFGRGLSPTQQALLGQVLVLAARAGMPEAPEPDVQGYFNLSDRPLFLNAALLPYLRLAGLGQGPVKCGTGTPGDTQLQIEPQPSAPLRVRAT
jgi:hypothetical protein